MAYRDIVGKFGIRGSKRVQILGDVAIVKVENPTRDFGRAVAEKLGVRAVVNIRRISGWERKPEAEIIYGNSAETIHREHGMVFRLDASKVMFSRGNAMERERMKNIAREGERILDMFAGIGYFTIPLGIRNVHREIVAIEKNPEAFKYLKENLILNRIRNAIPILSDNRNVYGIGKFDRIIMGYFPGTDKFLEKARDFSHEKTAIHYHNVAKSVEEAVEQIKGIFPNASILEMRTVKRYSPSLTHFCIDFMAGD